MERLFGLARECPQEEENANAHMEALRWINSDRDRGVSAVAVPECLMFIVTTRRIHR